MKILQSPYYQPRKLLSASSEPPYTVQLIEDSLQYASKYNPFESLLDDIFPGVHVGNHDMVIRKEQLKDFERCTDFTTVAYSHKAITVNKPHSLAELTNMDHLSYREKQAEKPKFGFV